MNNLEFNDPKYKLIALYYGISAIIGLGLITYQLFTNPFHILVFILYVLIYIQLVFMLFGALQYWDKRQTGLKILFWISLSLIPAFYTFDCLYSQNYLRFVYLFRNWLWCKWSWI